MFEDYCMVYYMFFLVSLPGMGFLVGVNKLNSWWSRSRNGNYKAPTVDYRLTKPHLKGSGDVPVRFFLFFFSHSTFVFALCMLGVPDYCSWESYVDDFKLYLSFPVKDIGSAAPQITEDLKKFALLCCQNTINSENKC